MWTITKEIKKGDYLYGVCKEHPKATKYGYVLMHRLIMENHLQRLLNHNEVVHHKNHNKHDNSIENLEILTTTEHSKLHAKRGRTYVDLICPVCKKPFKKEKRFLNPKTKEHKCSRRCNGIASSHYLHK
jgi:hypothetical protein